MKKINIFDMMSLFGGAAEVDCKKEVQDKAFAHEKNPNEKEEKDFWDEWADEFEDCANSKG